MGRLNPRKRYKMKKQELLKRIEETKTRSAWDRGVKEYATELIDYLDNNFIEELNSINCEKMLLNGASNWSQYSWGGCSLIYNSDIAERLCNPSELKKTRNGEWRPNKNEEWLDVQARALYQAYRLIKRILNEK